MLLSDTEIRDLGATMIFPFVSQKVREIDEQPVISFGLGSFGYDISIGKQFKIPNPLYAGAINPKVYEASAWLEVEAQEGSPFVLPAHSFCLAVSVERFVMPPDILGIALGKSTYARSGVFSLITPLEPEWEGQLVIEIANAGPLPVLIYPEEGIAQVIFIRGKQPAQGYSSSKYQDQKGIVHSSV